ncbi:Filamentous Growth Regulator [Sporothrix stenoceras]|uniref:Filamentous Growth Regulator n=1 Tax=Sporothrix stenoceras TaxID=5173 RepID=A0ABR3YR35_9PEZI
MSLLRGDQEAASSETSVLLPKRHGADDALADKMRLVDQAIDQIGFTTYHVKLFCLSGFGYAADSLMGFLISIAADQVVAEYHPSWSRSGPVALYAGLLLGSICWGLGADVLGRRGAFHFSLFVSMSGFGEGGNIALDATVFLEFLPSRKRWMVTTLACWWGVGQTAAGLFAWPFMKYSCPLDGSDCARGDNMGWRYLYITAGGIVLLMALARSLLIHLQETPHYLVSHGQDAEVVSLLGGLATTYGRPFDLTLENLQDCGDVTDGSTDTDHTSWLEELRIHVSGLFTTHSSMLTVILLWLAWGLIGLAYPLFYMFLPEYLASCQSDSEDESVNVWVGFALTNLCAIPGPIIAGGLCALPVVGRKGTMFVGAMVTMASFIGYTTVTTAHQSLFWSCSISLCINIYYANLYAYTPELLPAAHRATGYGVALAINRLMGIVAALVVTVFSTATATPLYICAGLLAIAAMVSLTFPVETQDKVDLDE